MPPITDPAALARVTALSAAVEEAAGVVLAARAAVTEAGARHAALRRSLAEHDAAKPADNPDVADDLSAMLAADPAAASSADWGGKLREAQAATAAAVAEWEGKRSILDQALSRVGGEHDDRQAAQTAAEEAHERAWAEFVVGARTAMTDELERRFASFYAEVMGPLDALNSARRLYSGDPVYSGPRRAVTADSILAIGEPRNGSICHDVKLYPAADRSGLPTLLENFRQRLALPAPAAPARGAAVRK